MSSGKTICPRSKLPIDELSTDHLHLLSFFWTITSHLFPKLVAKPKLGLLGSMEIFSIQENPKACVSISLIVEGK